MSCCGGWMTGWMILPWLLFLGILMVGVVLVVRALAGRSERARGEPTDQRAVRILEERYARGEIHRDEFEERRRALGP